MTEQACLPLTDSLADKAERWIHSPGGRHVMRDLYALASQYACVWKRTGIPVSVALHLPGRQRGIPHPPQLQPPFRHDRGGEHETQNRRSNQVKITEKVVCGVTDSIREDLSKIAEENSERLLKSLDEQIRAGGDKSISLTITVSLTDKGMAENAVEVATKFGFVRKVAEKDEYIAHTIDLGPTLFDTAKNGGAK